MINIRKNIIKYLSCILVASMFFCGCEEKEDVPELIAPSFGNQAFHPVEQRMIGTPKILLGQITPKEYCHFFTKAMDVKEITCDIGQYVNEGDVLAYADVEKLKEELEETRASLNLCIAKHDVNKPIFEYMVNSLQSQRSASEYLKDTDSVTKLTTQINVEKENHTYDEDLFSFMVYKYNEEITELEELIVDGTLKAKKSGYVTYIKNTTLGNHVNVNENVVIVSDYTDTHIEVPDLTMKDYKYKDFKVKYAMIDGKKVNIEEDNYSNQELITAKAQDCYPNVRFKTVEEMKGSPGDTILLYFLSLDKKSVLAVGQNSTNSDEKGNYVYVKGKEGEIEKRYFKAGISDNNYLEVISGLKEGEMVLYVQTAATPTKYEPYTVTTTDYVQKLPAKRYTYANIKNTAYFTPCDGKVESILVKTNDEVKKGEALLVIDSGGGKAGLTKAENDIKHLEQGYEKKCKDIDKQMKDLTVKSLRMITTIEEAETDDGGSMLSEDEIDAIQCQRGSLENEVKILGQQKEIAGLEYENTMRQLTNTYNKVKENNNGEGKITIYASDDGVVSKMFAKVGASVTYEGENSLLLSCTKHSADKVLVSISQNKDITGIAASVATGIGRELTFKGQDKDYNAVCVGSLSNLKNYAFTEGDKVYVTSCISDENQKNNFIAAISDSDFFAENTLPDCKVEIDALNIPQMIVLPGSMVYTEEVKLSKDIQYFVWKIENNELVKQYITTGASYGAGNDTQVVVLLGLSKGDVLAKEVASNVTENN